ncbi:MAG: glucose-1-phosphate adenylyltransferase subunit GlgD [Streptococcaceae bacterium]|jgi:glucose-1-phosphate adenylyltransferase|nr:glucose-1-phosphate adenylyltransferase subunit GlgD [Streptococcaceae bacterium]
MKNNRIGAIIGNIHQFSDLGDLVAGRPLATLPFAGKYRLIDFQLSAVANAGIMDIYSIYHTNQIQSVFDHIGSGREWGMDSLLHHYFLSVYEEDDNGIVAKDYIPKLINFLKRSKTAQTVYISSNMVANIDLNAVIQHHRRQGNKMTVGYKTFASEKMSTTNTVLEIDGNALVTGSHAFDLASASNVENMSLGLFVVETNWIIRELEKAIENEENIVSAQAWLNEQIGKVETSAYEYQGFVSNIHDVKSYYDANMDILDRSTFTTLFFSRNKVYTKVKNEAPTYYADKSEVRNSQFASGCVIRGTVEDSIVSRNVLISENSKIKGSMLMPKVEIGEGASVEYAILDKNVIVAAGVTIKGTKENPLVIKKDSVIKSDIID